MICAFIQLCHHLSLDFEAALSLSYGKCNRVNNFKGEKNALQQMTQVSMLENQSKLSPNYGYSKLPWYSSTMSIRTFLRGMEK